MKRIMIALIAAALVVGCGGGDSPTAPDGPKTCKAGWTGVYETSYGGWEMDYTSKSCKTFHCSIASGPRITRSYAISLCDDELPIEAWLSIEDEGAIK